MKKFKIFRGLAAMVLAAIMLLGAFGCTTAPSTTEPAQAPADPSAAPAASTAPAEPAPQSDVPAIDVPADRYDATATPRTGNNETMPLVINTLTLGGLFSPFFYTEGTDGDVVNYTQIGLLAVDSGGAPVAGMDQPSLAYSYEQEVSEDQKSSIHTMTLKRGITFSDGAPITMKDVLFSIYTRLDPCYDGSSTLYTLPIKGLKEYRFQSSEEQADQIETIVSAIYSAGFTIGEDGAIVYPAVDGVSPEDVEFFWKKLPEIGDKLVNGVVDVCVNTKGNDTEVADKVGEGITWADISGKKSLEIAFAMTCWNLGQLTPDLMFTDAVGKTYDLNSEEVTIMDCWDAICAKYNYDMSKVQAEANEGVPNIKNSLMRDFVTEKTKDNERITSVSGIEATTVVCDDGVEREALVITIDQVDPTAMYKLGVPVSPCHYYTNGFAGTLDEHGISFNDPAFMDCLKEKNKAPLGAGPYVFKEYKDNVVYFEANDLFMLGSPKIKNFRIQHVESGARMDAVRTGMVHFADPDATTANIELLNSSGEGIDKLGYLLVDRNGYGYIGMSAEAFPDWAVRKAFNYAMNTELTISDYYGELGRPLWRTEKMICWAYPKDATAIYPYDGTGETSKKLLIDAGYIYDEAANIMYYPENHEKAGQQLTAKATLPAEAADHPAGVVFLDMQKVLASIGVKVDIEVDTSAVSKLKLGYPSSNVAMWAAAWGDGPIDPDMFQVWYSDPAENQSDSPKAKGLYWLYENGSDEQKAALKQLNDLIKAGMSTLDIEERKVIYKKALEISTGLATEIPTYQRKDLFVFDKTVINADTLMPSDMLSPFLKPLDYIWNVELVG